MKPVAAVFAAATAAALVLFLFDRYRGLSPRGHGYFSYCSRSRALRSSAS